MMQPAAVGMPVLPQLLLLGFAACLSMSITILVQPTIATLQQPGPPITATPTAALPSLGILPPIPASGLPVINSGATIVQPIAAPNQASPAGTVAATSVPPVNSVLPNAVPAAMPAALPSVSVSMPNIATKAAAPGVNVQANAAAPTPLVGVSGIGGTQPNHNAVDYVRKVIDSPLQDIQWVNEKTVLVLSEGGVVYRSLDGGRSWDNQMRKFSRGPRFPSKPPKILSINISPVNEKYIFFVAKSGVNWYTKDLMTSVSASELIIRELRLHGAMPEWILASSMSTGCSTGGNEKRKGNSAVFQNAAGGACFKTLHVSQDFGATWRHILSYVVQFDWAPPIGDVPEGGGGKSRASDSIVYATVHDTQAGNQQFGFWDKDIHFVSSNDWFRSMRVLVPHGNRFLLSDHSYLFVATVNPHHDTQVSLQISRDNTTRLDFQKAIVPVQLTEHSYTILDTSESTVFLHVNHRPFDENAQSGHVYISDWTGLIYSLSLPYNQRAENGKCDFEKVEGLEGVYLANFLDVDVNSGKAPSTRKGKGAQGSRKKSTKNKMKNGKKKKQPNVTKRSPAMTVITFDKGGVWSYLVPPTVDSLGKPITCEGECHLHLHGITDVYGPFYSSSNAPGLIMGTGSVSTHLLSQPGLVNTYFSRDAGYSWSEVAKGSYIYEFGDHGGLIVMAPDEGKTDKVKYSWNQGHTWTEMQITDTPFQVENIIIEPSSTSLEFIVYGWDETAGVMVYLDFGALHERECQGTDAPDTGASDYELWTPSDGRLGDKCLLGRKVTYTRRKADRSCYNPEAHETLVEHNHCACTLEDFQCDYGYERLNIASPVPLSSSANNPGTCVAVSGMLQHEDPTTFGKAEGVCEGSYRVTKGYRRVPGDSCVGGTQWDAVEAPCPGWMSGSRIGKMILVLVLLLVVALGLVSLGNNADVVERMLTAVTRRFDGLRRALFERGYKRVGNDDDDDNEFMAADFTSRSRKIRQSPAPAPVMDKSASDTAHVRHENGGGVRRRGANAAGTIRQDVSSGTKLLDPVEHEDAGSEVGGNGGEEVAIAPLPTFASLLSSPSGPIQPPPADGYRTAEP